METSKKCIKCGTVKALEKFKKQIANKDGRIGSCRDCCNQQRRKHRSTPEGRAAKKEENRQYYHSIGNSIIKKYQREYKKKNRFKVNIRSRVYKAIKDRKIPTPKTFRCSLCKNQAVHYHHPFYAPEFWNLVAPLCGICHSKVHHAPIPPTLFIHCKDILNYWK